MMRASQLFLIAMSGLFFCGCTAGQISRILYDGVKTHNDSLRSTPPDFTSPRALSFDDYDRERRGLQQR
jgi:hypothetical protein